MINTLNQFVQDIYADEFGVLPTSESIKPVHVANGLGRALLGRAYESDALTEFLRRSILNQKTRLYEERNSNGVILDRYGQAFTGTDGAPVDHDRLSTLRSLANGVLATDGAVFGDSAMSSYTLSNEIMLTRDPSDRRCGAFLAQWLTAGTDGPAATYIRHMLSSDDDPWSVLAKPMMDLAKPIEGAGFGTDSLAPHARLAIGPDGIIASPTLATLRAAVDRLARFDQGHGSKLNSLRRIVMFSCFAIHVHLVSRYSEAIDGAARPPILIDMFDGSRMSLRNASRATLRAAGDVLEALVVQRIQEKFQAQLDAEGIEGVIQGLPVDAQVRVRQGFDAYRTDENVSELEALGESVWQVATEKLIPPVAFLTELGRRAGYLTPWANQGRGGKLQKRYGITTEFLETLVAATVDPGSPIDFGEFLDALRVNYGIIVGQRSDDQRVRHNNLLPTQFGTPTSVSEEDLRLNVEALRRSLIEAGYAKAYADGQTVITTEAEGLAVI